MYKWSMQKLPSGVMAVTHPSQNVKREHFKTEYFEKIDLQTWPTVLTKVGIDTHSGSEKPELTDDKRT